MKKMICVIAVLLLIVSAFPVGAFAEADENYDAVISAPESAKIDDTVEIKVYVRNIATNQGIYSIGLLSTSATLLFDTKVFEAVEYSAVIPKNWEHFDKSTELAEGKWTVFTAWDDDPFEGITNDDEIIITFKLKVIGVPDSGSTVLKIADIQGSNGSMRLFYGTGSETEISFSAFLPKNDSGLRLDKDKRTIVCAISNTKASDFVKLFKCDPSLLTVKSGDNTVSGASLVASGMTVTDGTDSYTLIIKGDVDYDGRVTATDYAAVKAHFKGSVTLSGLAVDAADVDENGQITTTDYLMIRRNIAGSYKFKV